MPTNIPLWVQRTGSNVMLYNLLVTKLAQTIAERMEANRQSRRESNIHSIIQII